jgi:glutathione S-transferase
MSLRLYRYTLSGHAHRAQLMLSLLGLNAELVDVDLLAGEQRLPGFLARNLFGQVPVLEDGDETIADSNAILVYLATRHDPSGRWYPRDASGAASVQRWLSVAAGQLANGPASARAAVVFRRQQDAERQALAARLFALMEQHLATQPFLAAAEPTIADIALYTYTAHAPEGGVSLEPYPAIRAWLARIEALPGFVGMVRQAAAAPLAA